MTDAPSATDDAAEPSPGAEAAMALLAMRPPLPELPLAGNAAAPLVEGATVETGTALQASLTSLAMAATFQPPPTASENGADAGADFPSEVVTAAAEGRKALAGDVPVAAPTPPAAGLAPTAELPVAPPLPELPTWTEAALAAPLPSQQVSEPRLESAPTALGPNQPVPKFQVADETAALEMEDMPAALPPQAETAELTSLALPADSFVSKGSAALAGQHQDLPTAADKKSAKVEGKTSLAMFTAPQAIQGAATPDAAEQVVQAISTRVEVVMTRQSSTEIHLRLEPPELGTVRVHLTASDHGIIARLVVQEQATQQFLESQMQFLRQRLAELCGGLGNVQVSCGQSGSHGHRQPPQQRAFYAESRVETLRLQVDSWSATGMTVSAGGVDVVV